MPRGGTGVSPPVAAMMTSAVDLRTPGNGHQSFNLAGEWTRLDFDPLGQFLVRGVQPAVRGTAPLPHFGHRLGLLHRGSDTATSDTPPRLHPSWCRRNLFH